MATSELLMRWVIRGCAESKEAAAMNLEWAFDDYLWVKVEETVEVEGGTTSVLG